MQGVKVAEEKREAPALIHLNWTSRVERGDWAMGSAIITTLTGYQPVGAHKPPMKNRSK